MIEIVDFFIIGWPKTGSTSLDNYLSQHPEIEMAAKKESYFFAKDIIKQADDIGHGYHYKYRSDADYNSLFETKSSSRIKGESSVFYIISQDALENIKKHNPNAKLIVLLREPSELLASWYYHLKQHSRENAHSIQEALMLQELRRGGKKIPLNTNTPIHLQYDEILNFPKHINKMLTLFNRENVKFIIYDDFKNDTLKIVQEVFHFLDVNSSFTPGLEKKNVSRIVKNDKTKVLVDSNKKNVVRILRASGLLKTDSFLHRIYKSIFTKNERRAGLPDDEKVFLKKRYAIMVEETQTILNINLKKIWGY